MKVKFVIKKFADNLAGLLLQPEYYTGYRMGEYSEAVTYDEYGQAEKALKETYFEEGSYQIEKVFIKE
jgi:hypothetical protein